MKKGIIRIAVSSVLVIIMLMQCFPVLALSGADVLSADSSALIKFNIEDVSGKPGDTVEVKISVSGEAEVSGLLLHMLTYDESALEFVEFKSGALVDSSLTKDASINGKTITLGYENNIIPNGEICTAVFSIKNTAEDGKYTIGFSRISASNNGREVSSELTAGTVTVSKWLVGDFDENGIVDMRDAVHFIGWVNFSYIPDLYPMVYDGNKDFNDDGTVDMQDAVYLIGWINFSFTGLYDIDWYGKGKCNHSMQHISAKAATCTEDGNIEYWRCDECGKYFSDAEGKTEITANETVLAQTGHMEVIDAAVLPTYDSTGLTEGSHCSKCGKILKNQDVIPKLEATYHSIIYKDTKGAEIPVDKMRYSEHEGLLDLPVISADGYTFKGWYTASEGGTKVDHIIKGSKDDKVLYAHWELVKYTITYKDAPIKNNQTEFTIEDEIVLNDPEWSGLVFKNWTDDNGNVVTKINKGTIGNITITANWMSEENLAVPSNDTSAKALFFDGEINRYYFVYDLGIIDNIVIKKVESRDKDIGSFITWKRSETVTIGKEISDTIAKSVSASVSKTDEWSETHGAVCSTTEKTELSAELNIKDILKVTAKTEDTTYSEKNSEIGTSGSTTDSSMTSESVSSSFICSAGSSVTVTTEAGVTEAMPKGAYHNVAVAKVHVYAIVIYDTVEKSYYLNTHSVLVETRGKILYEAPSNCKANISYSEGLPFNIPLFEKDANGNIKTDENGNYIPGDIMKHLNDVYYIQYDANGGAGEMLNTVHKIDKRENLASNKFTREGYVFTGWGLEPDGGALYPDNAEVTNISEKNETVTLYAIWEPIPYSVNWNDSDNCTIVVKRISSQISGVSCGTIAKGAIIYYGDVLSIEYKCNTGYSVLSHGSTSITVSGNITASEIYATVGANTYTIEYNANGGTGATSSSLHTYGQSEALTSNGFERHGWTFLGWNTKADGSGMSYSDKASVENLTSVKDGTVTLYAKWRIDKSINYSKSAFDIGKNTDEEFNIFFDDYVDLTSLKNLGYTKVTVIQQYTLTHTSNAGGYAISNIIRGHSYGGFSDCIINTNYDAGEDFAYTNYYYLNDNTNGQSYSAKWSNTFTLNDYSAIKIYHCTRNIYTDWFGGYKAPHKISNYTVTITFSK